MDKTNLNIYEKIISKKTITNIIYRNLSKNIKMEFVLEMQTTFLYNT